jgi:hypothetical protein
MRKLIVILGLLYFSSTGIQSQELLCGVDVNSQQIQGVDKTIFETLRNTMYEFMNNTAWTEYQYKVDERIECSILLTINEVVSAEEFKGTLTLALRRPVYNSSYNSPLFNYIDKDVQFSYVKSEPFLYSENTFTSNLTSILAYYAYVFIGLDFDSFTLEGGTPFYQVAQNIVNAAQSSSYKGWQSFENTKNRYWLVENLTNPSYKPVRSFLYEYHMKGLDMMYDNSSTGRANILYSLKYLQDVKKVRPGLLILQIITDAKRDEFVNVFSEGAFGDKSSAVAIFKDIDPANSTTYQKILQ